MEANNANFRVSVTPQPTANKKLRKLASNAKTVKPFDQIVEENTFNNNEASDTVFPSPEMNRPTDRFNTMNPSSRKKLELIKLFNTGGKQGRRTSLRQSNIKPHNCVLCSKKLHPIYEKFNESENANNQLK
jgi:hypothetical protein